MKHERATHLDNIDRLANQNKDDDQVQAVATQAFMDNGESKRALPHADQYVALARDSGNPELYNKALQLRANVNFSLKDYPSAARDAKDILKRNPNDEEAKNIYALSAGRGNASGMSSGQPQPSSSAPPPQQTATPQSGLAPTGDRKTMAQILSKAQQNEQMMQAAAFSTDAIRYMKLGDHAMAKKSLDQALAKAPGNAPLLIMRAKTNLELKDNAAALADAGAAVAADGNSAEAHLTLGQVQQAMNAPGFIKEFEKAKELDPRFTSEYEHALAAANGGGDINKQVDANGVGMAGRKAMQGFNPQAARDELFGFLPEPARKFAPIGIVGLMVALIAGIALILKRSGSGQG